MNTYLIPWSNSGECDILKITANSYEDCIDKVIEHYAEEFDSDALAECMDYDEFLQLMWDNHDIFLGNIHEIEEYESQDCTRLR